MIDVFDPSDLHRRYSWSSILSPSCGIVRGLLPIQDDELGIPAFRRYSAPLSNVSLCYPWVRSDTGESTAATLTGGAGGDLSSELASVRAVAEAAERYAAAVYDSHDYVVASANELGSEALDHRRWPACSDEEYARSECRLRPFDADQPLRWVQGHSTTRNQAVWVPLVMSHLLFETWDSEAFWSPITTGVAIHSCPFQAAVAAICEVVERDAIALTWLLQLPLPKLTLDMPIPEPIQRCRKELSKLPARFHHFDATTDIGVPTLYLLQRYEGHPQCATFVSCSTEFDPWTAYEKVMREACVGRTAMPFYQDLPDDPMRFARLEDGAAFMGRPSQESAFDFLYDSQKQAGISDLAQNLPTDSQAQFHWLVDRFRSLDFELTLVDLTPEELREAGLFVYRAIAPDLMPLDFLPASRFLAHSRLFDYPKSAGFPVKSAAEFNPYPQPFA